MKIDDRVSYKGRRGTVRAISPNDIHVLVVFDDPPAWPQIVDGGCWFYVHELTGARDD